MSFNQVIKHLPGQHSQASHGRGGAAEYKVLVSSSSLQQEAEDHIKSILNNIPAEHVEGLLRVIRYEMKPPREGANGIAHIKGAKRGIIQYQGRKGANSDVTLAHEIGHIALHHLDQKNSKLLQARSKLEGQYIKSENAVNTKARIDELEYAAESYAQFVVNPKTLRQRDQAAYDILKDIF